MCVPFRSEIMQAVRATTDTVEPFCAVAFCSLHALCSRAYKRTMPFNRKEINTFVTFVMRIRTCALWPELMMVAFIRYAFESLQN